MNKSKKSTSPLAWNQADYIAKREEIPEKLLHDTLHTEGELMSQEEMEAWIIDTNKTFCIVREASEDRFNTLFQEFTEDLQYLVSLGKLTAEDAAALLNKDLYTF